MMMNTAISMSEMPEIVFTPKCSSRKATPSTTAVKGCKAPRMEVSVGPILLTALTPVKLDTIVAHNPSPNMLSQDLTSVAIFIFPCVMNEPMMK